ncbi:bifunctional diguanylate cyclase/phosphodiesterase [Azorhizobium doebereinerae]|uniref:bifunctional diguanylate cyclase/phosphodiesterase n=1 Tax=Azorhizobium doebereinerae TaxID=281091 RepID=UPI000424E18A|nr:EAL domain-containing protein [Azorhizobium doebereinerae]
MVIGALLLTLSLRTQAYSDRRRELQNLALALAEQSDRALQSLQLVQTSIIERVTTANIDTPEALGALMSSFEIHEALREKISGLPFIDAVTIIDQNGKLLNFSRFWPVPTVNVSDRDYYLGLRDSRGQNVFVSLPVPNRGTGTTTIYLARRFNTPAGAFFGLVLGAMEQSYFEQFYGTIKLGRDGNITLYRDDGAQLAAYPHNPADAQPAPAVAARIARDLIARQPEDGLAPAGLIDERPRLVAVQQLANYPLVVAVSDTTAAIEKRLRIQTLPIAAAAALICLAIAVAVILAIRQLREQARFAAAAHHAARHDDLTGLPNRLLFGERLTALLASRAAAHPFAVLFLDLDYFKSVNDTLGHAVGDQLLRAVAARLAEEAHPSEVVARIGGDEFAIINTHADQPEAALALAERVIARISRPISVEDHRVIAGGTIGIAMAPADGTSVNELLKNADLALYRAKAEGRGQARLFLREMEHTALARRALELDLREAWENGQFFLVFQPFFHVETRALAGFEALLRWRHPTRGIVSPATFIGCAEETGLILPLGAWVLSEACRTAAEWPEAVRLAVNLSPLQFRSGHMADHIRDALRASGLAPRRLELELTESTLLIEGTTVRATLEQVRAQGITIALDDFGTGYSSLGYLRTLPIDRIKIDRTFISRMCEDPHSRAIVHAVLQLSSALELETTAEGIEQEEQVEVLRAEGCGYVQGFLLGRPMRATEAREMAHRLTS